LDPRQHGLTENRAVLTFDGTIRRSGADSTLVPIPSPTT